MAQAHCPICKKILEGDFKDLKNPSFFPFCSQRCKLVDLQGWFSGRYRFSSPLKDEKNNKNETENLNEETSETS